MISCGCFLSFRVGAFLSIRMGVFAWCYYPFVWVFLLVVIFLLCGCFLFVVFILSCWRFLLVIFILLYGCFLLVVCILSCV